MDDKNYTPETLDMLARACGMFQEVQAKMKGWYTANERPKQSWLAEKMGGFKESYISTLNDMYLQQLKLNLRHTKIIIKLCNQLSNELRRKN